MCFGFDKFYFPDRVIALGDLFQTNRLFWAWGVAEHWGNSILFWNRGMNARWPNAEGAFYQVFFYYVLNNEICPFLKFSGTIATKITALALLSMFDNSHLDREWNGGKKGLQSLESPSSLMWTPFLHQKGNFTLSAHEYAFQES